MVAPSLRQKEVKLAHFLRGALLFAIGYLVGENAHGSENVMVEHSSSCDCKRFPIQTDAHLRNGILEATKLPDMQIEAAKKEQEELVLQTIHKQREQSKYNYRMAHATTYLLGYGIEIGAKATPQPVPKGAYSINVDHMSTEDLIVKYTGDTEEHKAWVEAIKKNPVMRVDDAETLSTFEDDSLDFIVANHVLEHVSNFLGTLEVFARKLRVGGIAFFALPDKRFVPEDYPRPVTSPDLFLEELRNKDLSTKRKLDKIAEGILYRSKPDGNFDQDDLTAARESAKKDIGGAHIHTFTTESLMLTLSLARIKHGFPLQLASIQQVHNENIVVLRKVDGTSQTISDAGKKCYATGLADLKSDAGCPKNLSARWFATLGL